MTCRRPGSGSKQSWHPVQIVGCHGDGERMADRSWLGRAGAPAESGRANDWRLDRSIDLHMEAALTDQRGHARFAPGGRTRRVGDRSTSVAGRYPDQLMLLLNIGWRLQSRSRGRSGAPIGSDAAGAKAAPFSARPDKMYGVATDVGTV